MSIDSTPALKDLEEALLNEPDGETMRKACDEMDRLREETRQQVGIVDVAVQFVRDARDS
jgi:YD repeat-containing protein